MPRLTPNGDDMMSNASFRVRAVALAIGIASLTGLVACGSNQEIADTEDAIFPDSVERTRARLQALSTLIEEHRRRANQLPQALADLSSTSPNGQPSQPELIDAWSRPFRYQPNGPSFELRSAGADGQFGTVDDVLPK